MPNPNHVCVLNHYNGTLLHGGILLSTYALLSTGNKTTGIKSAMMIISIYDYDWTRFKVYDYLFEIDSKLKTDRFRIYL